MILIFGSLNLKQIHTHQRKYLSLKEQQVRGFTVYQIYRSSREGKGKEVCEGVQGKIAKIKGYLRGSMET